jgi:Transposase DDE domain
MNDTLIVTVFVTLDDLLCVLGHQTDCRARTSDSEVLTVAVIAACKFQNHHECALCVLRALGYLSGPLSLSRFNRRLHRLARWFDILLDLLSETFAGSAVFIIDSLPVPVCRRVRAGRCRKVQGAIYCGYCAAKEEKFFGWRLHLVVTLQGVPVSFELLPASLHDLTPVHDLTQRLPSGVTVYGDKAYNSAEDEAWIDGETGIALIPRRRKNMRANSEAEQEGLRRYRGRVETVNSQLEAWGVQRLHARTQEGWVIKVMASLFALVCVNAN